MIIVYVYILLEIQVYVHVDEPLITMTWSQEKLFFEHGWLVALTNIQSESQFQRFVYRL